MWELSGDDRVLVSPIASLKPKYKSILIMAFSLTLNSVKGAICKIFC